jgi:predicted phage tail protein
MLNVITITRYDAHGRSSRQTIRPAVPPDVVTPMMSVSACNGACAQIQRHIVALDTECYRKQGALQSRMKEQEASASAVLSRVLNANTELDRLRGGIADIGAQSAALHAAEAAAARLLMATQSLHAILRADAATFRDREVQAAAEDAAVASEEPAASETSPEQSPAEAAAAFPEFDEYREARVAEAEARAAADAAAQKAAAEKAAAEEAAAIKAAEAAAAAAADIATTVGAATTGAATAGAAADSAAAIDSSDGKIATIPASEAV